MDLRKLKTLIDLVSESNISELEIAEADGKVRIVKAGPPAPATTTYVTGPLQAAPQPYPSAPASDARPAAGETSPAAPVASPEDAWHVVCSPMVGTFYRSANPGSEPFAEVGSTVKEGQAICIIEAMKIMNEIESDHAGTVRKIFCENGQAVEFGQPLFAVE